MTNLKPCPFCGGEAEAVHEIDGFWTVECIECGALVDGITAWNTRVERTCMNEKDKWSRFAKYLFVCSECGWNLADVGNDAIDISVGLMKRCPMCGAKIIEGERKEDEQTDVCDSQGR